MSEPIPESIPTSADPRSKRPLKKRALTPSSQTAQQLDALFAKPDQEIRLPTSGTSLVPKHDAPPEIVANVQGSSAGAGSGEFHVYKASRRREYERLRGMDEEVRRDQDLKDFEREKRETEERDREKTRKNREKREKKVKRRKGGAGSVTGASAEKGDEVKTGGGVKARASNGVDAMDEDGQESKGVEQIGVIIHDDD
ncbi:hypothetical protein B7494_g6278 [Chlorociboria aeruginascens]|nr:hypothetical protein B7494_g6278 [Chlorociboria aeruginascens]